MALAARQREDRPGGRAADAGQRRELLDGPREIRRRVGSPAPARRRARDARGRSTQARSTDAAPHRAAPRPRRRTLGKRAMKRSKYGITVATWVCCSITSDTHTRYGVGFALPRQSRCGHAGRTRSSSRSAKPAMSAAPRMSHPIEIPGRIIAQAGANPADTSREGARPRPPIGSGCRMRSWPVRIKLLALPMVAAALVMATTLWLVDTSRRYDQHVRAAVHQALDASAPLSGRPGRDTAQDSVAAVDDALSAAARSKRERARGDRLAGDCRIPRAGDRCLADGQQPHSLHHRAARGAVAHAGSRRPADRRRRAGLAVAEPAQGHLPEQGAGNAVAPLLPVSWSSRRPPADSASSISTSRPGR